MADHTSADLSPHTEAPNGNDPERLVRDLLAALTNRDRSAVDLLAEDVWWLNVGLPVVRGRRRVWAAFEAMWKYCEFAVTTHNLAVSQEPDGSAVVLTERTDVLIRGRVRCEFWVCGRFEISDGKIAGWKDYYSMGNMMGGIARGLLAAARGTASGEVRTTKEPRR